MTSEDITSWLSSVRDLVKKVTPSPDGFLLVKLPPGIHQDEKVEIGRQFARFWRESPWGQAGIVAALMDAGVEVCALDQAEMRENGWTRLGAVRSEISGPRS